MIHSRLSMCKNVVTFLPLEVLVIIVLLILPILHLSLVVL